MKKNIFFILLALLGSPIAGFNQTKFSPKDEALRQFNRLKPGIEKAGDGIMQDPDVVTGDINGDKLPDCIISYILTPKEGGNMVYGHECLIYLNTGTGMKAAGKFPEFKFCYALNSIHNGLIVVNKFTCAPPYNDDLGKSNLAYRNGKIVVE
jgi:hypothetical protein